LEEISLEASSVQFSLVVDTGIVFESKLTDKLSDQFIAIFTALEVDSSTLLS
jgi:hypothetical protein